MPTPVNLLFALLAAVLLPSRVAQAQDYRYHPVFLYSFSKYIEWPEGTPKAEFVITVVGNEAAYEEIGKMTQKREEIKGKTIKVLKARSIREVLPSHIVFITNDVRFPLSDLQKYLGSKPILIVTEHPGIADRGTHINFVTLNEKITFELNKTLALQRGFKIATGLEMLASKIY
ncbi:MAG: YfiR family protein [Cytophagales bacterium]|nr:YfiR family protein [Cytophagales bacterium]